MSRTAQLESMGSASYLEKLGVCYTFPKTSSYFSCYCLVHVVICLALVSD